MPTECEHGKIVDWGDFGPSEGAAGERCVECETDHNATRFIAWVADAGGGQIQLTVHRNLKQYPPNGKRVLVLLYPNAEDERGAIGGAGYPTA